MKTLTETINRTMVELKFLSCCVFRSDSATLFGQTVPL
jgi:hypothetical protein